MTEPELIARIEQIMKGNITTPSEMYNLLRACLKILKDKQLRLGV